MSRVFAYLSLSTLALTLLACESPEAPGSEAGTETGDGDGDPTTGDGDGDGDGDPTTGDGDGEPEPDTDQDGIGDSSDNCPDDPNPNQRDFDGNGTGNVCEVQVFANVSGTLNSDLFVDGSDLGDCVLPLALEVTGGEVRIQLDDDAAMAGFEIVNLTFADVPTQDCDIAALTPVIGVEAMSLVNGGEAFPVAIPHSPEDHDAGTIVGTAGQHPVLLDFTITIMSNGGSQETNDFAAVDSALPMFDASVTEGGAKASLTWNDDALVMASDSFTTVGEFEQELPFELRGLAGTLDLQP